MPDIVTQKLPMKTAIYIRVSTQFQIDKDSLKVQLRELTAYSEIVLGISDCEVFEDPGYSGKNTDRPAYQSMMNRLRKGEFSHLLVWKIDRISRNLLDFSEMYDELKRLGVAFVSKNEQFDTSSPVGEAMLKIILVFAELERKMTAERVTAVMLSRANNGQWNGGRIPFGYSWDSKAKEFSINPEEADVVKMIYDQYEDKLSMVRVCDYLNERGYRTKTGIKWHPVALHKILRSIFYLGHYQYNVHDDGRGGKKRDPSDWITIKDHHPALIDEDQFDRVQRLLKRNLKRGFKAGETRKGKVPHIFAGLLECGYCGANMSASQDKRRSDGWRPSVYGCSIHRRHKGKCANKFVTDVYLAPLVLEFLLKILNAKRTISAIPSVEALQSHILDSPAFESVKALTGLDDLYNMLKTDTTEVFYAPRFNDEKGTDITFEVEHLKRQKSYQESALRRLQSLYLYGDDVMSETDYIIERQSILSKLEELEKQMAELGDINVSDFDASFERRASYFLIANKLLDFDYTDSEKFIRSIEPTIMKDFMNIVIGRIKVKDGLLSEVRFKNEITIGFIYE